MSPSLFTGAILRGEAINIFNEGKMQRDFTYIDDIVEGVVRVIDKIAEPDLEFDANESDPATSYAPFRVYNIGNNEPVQLMEFIDTIENAVGKKAEKNMMGMQNGDVVATYANIDALIDAVGFKPSTPLKDGIQYFVDWYKQYHGYH
jgi:UDP-glucuronate 4-epimerase